MRGTQGGLKEPPFFVFVSHGVTRNLKCKRIQCDEIWAFVYSKDKNIPQGMAGKFGVGSVWTWTALDADTKLIPCWMDRATVTQRTRSCKTLLDGLPIACG